MSERDTGYPALLALVVIVVAVVLAVIATGVLNS